MSITAEQKSELIKKFAQTEGDTGSPEVQVAILTTRINNLTGHFKDNKKTTIPVVAFSKWLPRAGNCWTI